MNLHHQPIRSLTPLTADQIDGLRKGKLAIYVFGVIKYHDAWNNAHITTYRLRHNEYSGAVGVSTELTGMAYGNYSN